MKNRVIPVRPWSRASLLMCGVIFWTCTTLGAAASLTYISPWGGVTAEKERRIVTWAAEQAGVEVDMVYPGGGVQGVADQILVYQVSGVPVDIVWNHQSTHFQFDDIGAWLDLSDYIEQEPDIDVEDFAPGAIGFFTDAGGRITGIPFRWSFTVLNYNKDLFDEVGLVYPNSTWRFEEEFLEAARRLTRVGPEREPVQWGVTPLRLHDFVWRAWGAELLTPDKQSFGLTDPAAQDGLQFLRDLYVTWEVASRGGLGPWRAGTSAMAFEHPVLEHSRADLRWDIAEVPIGPSAVRSTRGAVGGWSIPSWSSDPDAAWRVLRHLASKEGQTRYLIEGLGGTRLDSIRDFLISDYDPANFGSPVSADSFQNRDVYLEAITYAEVDVDRTRLNVHEMSHLLGSNGEITRPDRPVSHILDELERAVEARLAELSLAP